MEAVIITGMSGAGKTLALNHFEDMGYYCMENLPPKFIVDFVELINNSTKSIEKLAIVIDVRARFFEDLSETIQNLKKMDCELKVLFLDASNRTLINRYKELRRPHPVNPNGALSDSIELEREMLSEIKDNSDIIIDTTRLSASSFKNKLNTLFFNGNKKDLVINIESFGFKNGILVEADLVFDVRFLPNPYYIEELKELNGKDDEIQNYVMGFDDSKIFLNKVVDLLEFLIPKYKAEGKNMLTIGVGCTGGKHRSVCLAEKIYSELKKEHSNVNISHRDERLW
ncbi:MULTISPECIES: RNase adapter RapZ [Parvimonas]|uniref:RNase adapter RapZ n=1 Tax=Parvimonas TaxID=543311 RepID=UPI0012392E61|nr:MULTISPECIES: RNase adapter RapZ [Parvimonas]MCK6129680.1 RNase adapter RapZ [Parvimonas micra]MCK6135326.1 RNase adapter RapZ [Parvimonas micra]MCK6136798.1 RNase adapter RapZ [Parvimonas micra]MCK6153325.1 RNase adapter RapZ [Parvimonas micra]MCZ7408325.1 RNase adapter RapZ [Parvimonas micra]